MAEETLTKATSKNGQQSSDRRDRSTKKELSAQRKRQEQRAKKERKEQIEKQRYIKTLFELASPAVSLEVAAQSEESQLIASGALENHSEGSTLILINPSSLQTSPPSPTTIAPVRAMTTEEVMDSVIDGNTSLNDEELGQLLTQLIPEDEMGSMDNNIGNKGDIDDPSEVESDNSTEDSTKQHNRERTDKSIEHPAVEYIPTPSAEVLPDLYSQNQQVDFVLLSGWRTFDYIFTDFFYIDKLLKSDGLILFDHADKPSTRKLCRYIVNNLPYEYVSAVREKSRRPLVEQLLHKHLKKIPIVSDKVKQFIRPEILDTEYATILDQPMIALRKASSDTRSNSFHEAF